MDGPGHHICVDSHFKKIDKVRVRFILDATYIREFALILIVLV